MNVPRGRPVRIGLGAVACLFGENQGIRVRIVRKRDGDRYGSPRTNS